MWDKIGYHATAAPNLESILKVGLLPHDHGWGVYEAYVNEGVVAVYMFSDEAEAEYFARDQGLDAIVVADCTDLPTEADPGWLDGTDAWRVLGPGPARADHRLVDYRRVMIMVGKVAHPENVLVRGAARGQPT
jgi:hypothetical protein